MTHNHTEHLQTPLRVIKGEVNSFRPSRTCYRIVDASGEFVARLHDKEPADTLCRFVNSHARLVEALGDVANRDNLPEYHQQGMGCGLEDRDIHDRYEAMAHGWDCAIERMYEMIDGSVADQLAAAQEPTDGA